MVWYTQTWYTSSFSVLVKTLAETPPPLSKNRFLRRGGGSMNEIQILGNLPIWAIFRAPVAREEKFAIFALRNHHFVFKNPKFFRAPAAREEKTHILPLEMMVLCSKITKNRACGAKKKHFLSLQITILCLKTAFFSRLRRV